MIKVHNITQMIFLPYFQELIILLLIEMISQSEWPQQGEYIDFRDKDNNPWQVGYVLLKAKSMIKVRSEGWSSKFDELIQISNNSRIKPFRSIVRGYTGQVKNPALREHWKYTPQLQQQHTQRFHEFTSQLCEKSEHEIRQFLRGHHYFWVDFLLTVAYASPEELLLGYEYLKQHIKFTKKYLDDLCEVGVYQWCTENNNLSENVRAYRESYYQIMDGLYILTGINLRQLTFQKNNEKIIKQAVNDNLTHDRYITRYMAEVKLDETYLKLLNLLEKETFVDLKVIPISFLYQFFHIFSPIEKALLQKTDPPYDNVLTNKEERKKMAIRIFNIIKKQIQYLNAGHLKPFQVEKQIETFLSQLRPVYYKFGLEQLAFEWVEKVRLKIAILLVQSDTLERKLKGIVKLKDIYESLITVNDLNPYKLKPEDFISFLSENKIIQQLFQNNEHPEILKKGGQICQLLLKSHFIQIDSVIAIWKICSHKHEAVKKVIYQLWTDILQFVGKDDLLKFTQPILESCVKGNEEHVVQFVEEWEAQILFAFVLALVKHYQEQTEGREQIDGIFARFIDLLYEKLIFFEKSNQIKNLTSSFSKLINLTTLCNKIIKQCYQSIAKNEHVRLNVELLSAVYQQSFEKSTFLPSNAIQIIFLTFQSPDNHALSPIIFHLMDEIINFSNNIAGHYILTQQEFESLWKVSQENEAIKSQFYSWLVKKNNDGLFGVPVYEISPSIPHDLKSTIFKNFLCDYSKFDYFNLSLEELHIFKEFLVFQNDQDNRIEVKRLMALMKIIRVKNSQTLGNKFMWDIFLNCKNEEVIQQLSKLILVFHFNFHEAVDFKTRKAKIVSLMVKIDKHIKDGFKKGNLKLMKHSLILLKDIIDFVKEKKSPKEIMQNYQQYFKTTIKILFQNKKFDLEIFFGITYYEIKAKIAELIKVERTKFQIFSLKNQEISLQFFEVPFCFMQQKTIKVIRVLENEETIPHIVLNFIKDRVQSTLIDMLQDESICENVYKVLQQIEIKVEEGEFLLDKITNIIQKHKKQEKGDFSKYQIYIHLFYLRILHFMIDRPNFLLKFIKNKQINYLIQKLQVNITSPLSVIYLYHCLDIIFSIQKKLKLMQVSQEVQEIMADLKENLKQKCMRIIDELCHYINQKTDEEKTHSTKKVRIIFNCLNIIQQLQKGELALIYIVNHERFCQIVRKIYVNDSMNEIRLIFVQKLKKIINKYRQSLNNNKEQQRANVYFGLINRIAHFFIRELYYEINQKDGTYSDQKKATYFYRFISFIITILNDHQFSEFVIGGLEQNRFYEDLLTNIKHLSDLPVATAGPNHIFSAHLHILTAIYQTRPSLLDQEMLHYLLYDCLFYKQGESHRLDVACKKPQTIKAALDAIQAGITDFQHVGKITKVIRDVHEFHKIDYWRTSDNWSTSIENQVRAKYVGLENPGCICYHNSLLQQLFMTPAFRNAISTLNLSHQEGDTRLDMLKSLKNLFFNLLYSEEIALNPVFFTKTIKSHDNKPLIKIFVQMDIDEFCSILFDKIEHQLTFIPNQPNIVKNIFGGVYAHQIISKQCKHCSQRQQNFISIGLQVKKNIVQSFNSLIKGEMLDGENKYYCEKCDKKVKAEKILTIKKLPQNLILSIKRFQYNYEIDAKIKINDYCEFPMELNLKKYSQQQINKANTPQNLQFSQQNTEPISEELPDSYFMYKLKGVVVHTGSADSGHYYSFIEDQDKNWFQFNDSSVSPFDIKNLPQEAFGAKDSYEDKVKNAYLLFYERVEQNNQAEAIAQEVTKENSSIIHDIIDKNKTISKFRLLFSKDYSGFVDYLFANIQRYDLTLKEREYWFEYLISYYLLIKIREGSVDETLALSNKVSYAIQTSKHFSEIFLNSVISLNFLEEVFVYASNRDKIKIISKLLTKSFINYYLSLPGNTNSLKETQVEQLFNNIKALTIIHGNIYQLQMFIVSILEFARSKNDYRVFKFLQHSYEQTLLINLLGFPIPKEEKQMAIKYKEGQRVQSNVLSPAKNEGKKYLPASTKASWQIIQYFIQYLETNIVQQDHQQEVLDSLTLINNWLEKSAKSGILTRLIHECGVSKSVYRLYKVFKHTRKIQTIIQAIEKGLKDYESTKYRQLLLLLYFIVIDNDCSEEMIRYCIGMLERVHAINEKYFLQVNFVHQWIIKYAYSSPLFLKVFSEYQDFLTVIINWIVAKPLPSAELVKKHKNPANQRLLNRIHGLLVSTDPKDYQKKSHSLKKKFEGILNKKFQLVNSHIQWEKEFLDEFYPGGEAYYFDLPYRRWIKAKINEDNFGYLKLAPENSAEISIWDDNERLFSFKTLKKQDLESSSSSQEEIVEERMEPIDEQDLYN